MSTCLLVLTYPVFILLFPRHATASVDDAWALPLLEAGGLLSWWFWRKWEAWARRADEVVNRPHPGAR